jgi:hypothetical protein
VFFGVRDLWRAAHTRSMEDREHELPLATARPRRFWGRLTALRGAIARGVRGRLRRTIDGRSAVFLLTGVFFSAMMVCMGYVADRAKHAADAIDEAQRAAQTDRRLGTARWTHEPHDEHEEEAEPEAEAPTSRDHVLFYVTGGER